MAMKRLFAANVWREVNWYVFQCLEVDVASQGATEQEALANLKGALELHFEPPQATNPLNDTIGLMSPKAVIIVDPEIMNGTPCFRGTRVPFKNLIDYLEGGHSLGEFLEQFPTVTREMAIQALEEAKESLVARVG